MAPETASLLSEIRGYATLGGVIWILGEIRVSKWKLDKLWSWYEKLHGMNGGENSVKVERRINNL